VSKLPILLLGAGGHARACIDVIELEARFSICGLVGIREQVGTQVLGYPVLCSDEKLSSLIGQHPRVLVAVGQIKSPEPRIQLFRFLEQLSSEMPTIVSPRAYVSRHATIAAGTIVMHGAVVNAGAKIGRNCILNSQSLVEHDTVIGDHCHISTAAAVNSGVRIGAGSFVGSNVCVRQGVAIGERCVIGMGQRVLSDCNADTQLPAAKLMSTRRVARVEQEMDPLRSCIDSYDAG
jgi:sugar O-acyltransferase (sialic acid O-acetyltransferase NeuD family)